MMRFLMSTALLSGCTTNKTFNENGISGAAPDVLLYTATDESCCGEDPHPVHGAAASDGSYVLAGKTIDTAGQTDGFVVRMGPNLPSGSSFLSPEEQQNVSWSHRFGAAGETDAANSVAVTAAGVFVVGVQSEGGVPSAMLRKLVLDSGALSWTGSFPAQDGESASECIHVNPDGSVVVGGLINGESGGLEGFKSYGNPTSGSAHVSLFSAEQLASSSAPDQPDTEWTFPELGSVRAIKPVDSDGYVLVAPSSEELYTVLRIDSSGQERWSTDLPNHGEATDIAVLSDQGQVVGFAVTGHKHSNGGIDGSITKLELDGSIAWSVDHGDPFGGVGEFSGLDGGNPELIYDECWGIQPTEDGGAVIACGTGIEGCEGLAALSIECNSDPRRKWRSLLIAVDGNGSAVWHRTDSYVFAGESEAAASAAEHIIRTESGQLAAVIDQDFGIGLLVLDSAE